MGQVDVLAPQLVGVAGLARGLLEDRRRHLLGEPGVAVAVVALDLVAGRCGAEEEALREAACRHVPTSPEIRPHRNARSGDTARIRRAHTVERCASQRSSSAAGRRGPRTGRCSSAAVLPRPARVRSTYTHRHGSLPQTPSRLVPCSATNPATAAGRRASRAATPCSPTPTRRVVPPSWSTRKQRDGLGLLQERVEHRGGRPVVVGLEHAAQCVAQPPQPGQVPLR